MFLISLRVFPFLYCFLGLVPVATSTPLDTLLLPHGVKAPTPKVTSPTEIGNLQGNDVLEITVLAEGKSNPV